MTGARRYRDWQKTDPHLRRHPMFVRFRAELGVSTTEAHGILSGLWAFAFDFAHDGDLSRFTPADIALAIDWDGDPDVLWSALSLGFVTDGEIHHWHEWGGALFFVRKTDAERKWDERNADKQEKVSTDKTGQCVTMPQRRREKRRGVEQDQEPLSDSGESNGARNVFSDFEEWWSAYGRVGSKAEAMDLYRWWRTTGKAPRDALLAAAVGYRLHCELDGSKMQHGRTFLAKATKDKSARWPEWAHGEDHGTMDVGGNGKGDAVSSDRSVSCFVCSTPIDPDELLVAPFSAGHGYCHKKCAKVKS